MEVPFSRNPPNLQVVPQIDPRYADMAVGEAYSAYNAKAMFADTEISKNLEDARPDPKLEKLTAFFDSIHKQEQAARQAARGQTPEDQAGRAWESKSPANPDLDVTQTPFTQTGPDPDAPRGQTPATTTKSRTPG